MRTTTKIQFFKQDTLGLILVIGIILSSVIAGAILSQAEPYFEVQVENMPKNACVEAHITLNKNETHQICGKVVSAQ